MIGQYSGKPEGPTVIILGGVHGNEPSAINAMQQVFDVLKKNTPPFRGKFIGLIGNLEALASNMRFVDQDLNRMWTPERLEALAESPLDGFDETGETREQRELFNLFQTYFQNGRFPVYVLDFHTTSSESPPFVMLADTIRNRQFGLSFKTPIILGLEELLEGTIMHFAGDRGLCTLALESGQHNDANSIRRHVAATWISLVKAGCISQANVPNYHLHQQLLAKAVIKLPKVFEVRFRYGIQNGEQFEMMPGFKNFQPIRKGNLLARNKNGNIYSHLNGYIFMPLYQTQGSDGYFIIRKVNFVWLNISKWMRKLKIEKLLPFLPGINRSKKSTAELVVNRKIARWFVIEIFHLLGYRRKRIEDNSLIVTRRKFDFYGPEKNRGE